MVRWLWKKKVDDEVAEELDFHLEMRTQELIARGLDPAAARAAALNRFGDLERVRKVCRDIGRRRDSEMLRREVFSELRQDVTFALRSLLLIQLSLSSRCSRWLSASAPRRPSSAPSTPWCCGRCRCPGRTGWRM